MFEAAELGRKLSKQEFQAIEPDLHTRLIKAQQALKNSNSSVIIIVSGVEGTENVVIRTSPAPSSK